MRPNTKQMFMKELERLNKKKDKLQGDLEIGKRCGDKLYEAIEDAEEVYLMMQKCESSDKEAQELRTINHQIIRMYKEGRFDDLNAYLITVGGIAG